MFRLCIMPASEDSVTTGKSKKLIGADGKVVKDGSNKTKSGRFKRELRCFSLSLWRELEPSPRAEAWHGRVRQDNG